MKTVLLFFTLLSVSASTFSAASANGPSYFLYLSDQRVVTMELVDDEKLFLNYINLSDGIEIVQAPMALLLDGEGRPFRGHVLEDDGVRDSAVRYGVSRLLNSKEFAGYAIRGDFRLRSPVAEAYFRQSGLILKLEELTRQEFDIVETRIGRLDLGLEQSNQALRRVGFTRGYGSLIRVGTPEAERLDEHFPSLELLPPVLLANPAPRVLGVDEETGEPLVVQVEATVSRNGGIYDVSVLKGVRPDLDRIATETVENSWRFLPAIASGQVAEAKLTLNVVFPTENTLRSPR